MRVTAVFALLAATALVALALMQGWPQLLWDLPGGLPLGTALAALALCAPAVVALLLSPAATADRRLAQVALVAGMTWLPVSILMAGNPRLNFTGGNSTWLLFTAITALLVILALAWAAARFAWRRRGGAP